MIGIGIFSISNCENLNIKILKNLFRFKLSELKVSIFFFLHLKFYILYIGIKLFIKNAKI